MSPNHLRPSSASSKGFCRGFLCSSGILHHLLLALGAAALGFLYHLGGMFYMLKDSCVCMYRGLVLKKYRFGFPALYTQLVRIGVRSVLVVALVNFSIGFILALQMSPPLSDFGQTDQVAAIIAIAVVRELGPLISAIVLTGFAGASIAAELGTMVVGEEIEALQAHGLNPIRFLVVPRILATVISLFLLTVLGILIALGSGMLIGVTELGISYGVYKANTIEILSLSDFFTGLSKALIFGVTISLIACYQGLNVKGGAMGVGLATTRTVVLSIMTVIFTDLLMTALFYALGWN